MIAYGHLADKDFVAEGRTLFNSYQALFASGKDSDEIIEPIREWLDAATERQCTLDSYIWGGLCQAVLERHPQDSKLFDIITKLTMLLQPESEADMGLTIKERSFFLADRDRVVGYLHAMSTISKDDFFQVVDWPATRTPFHSRGYDQKPACDALLSLFQSLATKTAGAYVPMQKALFETDAWDPMPLLHKLQAWREEQTLYGKEQSTSGFNSFANSTQGVLLSVLLKAMAYSNWKPTDEKVCAEFWSLIDFSRWGKETAIIREQLWKHMPNQLGLALQSVGHVNNFTPDLLNEPFALPGAEDDQKAMLLGLVEVYRYFLDGLEYTPDALVEEKRGFVPLIEKHHPQLHALLSMHMIVFPEEAGNPEQMDMLFSGFQALSLPYKPAMPDALTLPEGL